MGWRQILVSTVEFRLNSYDTLQFSDYDAYENSRFDPKAKQVRHEEVFPKDLEQAFELGRRMALPMTEPA